MNAIGKLTSGCLLLLVAVPSAYALRCGNRVVGTGDYDFQVRDRCGDPYYIEDHFALLATGADTPVQTIQQTVYTAWFYNFGPSRLLVRLLFRDGRLVRERTLGRGVDDIGGSCAPADLISGANSGELIANCGQPVSRNLHPLAQVRRLGPGIYSQRDDSREDWIYDLGGNFLYVLHMVNGHVEAVEHIAR